MTEEERGPAPWAPLESPAPAPAPPPPPPPWQPSSEAPPWQQSYEVPPWQPSSEAPPWQQSYEVPPWQQAYEALPKAGDARTGPLPLHPMTVSDILDGAFKLLKANWRTLVLITAAFVVPLHIVSAFVQRNLYSGRSFFEAVNNPALQSGNGSSNAQLAVGGVVALISLLVTPFVAGAISKVVAASYLGGVETAGSALRATGRRTGALFGAWLLVHVLEGFGALFCILPGLIFMALFVAVAPAIVIEGLGPIRGMRRSWRLMAPRLFPVMGVALVAGLLAGVVGNALGTVPSVAALAIGLKYGWPLLAAGSILSALITTPFVAIVATLLYFDGRIRQEGFDLQVMADQLARRPPP